ncbi:MAG: tetratricopeptide repeat protein [Chloroflexi bacterium]|nr:tetratricopeptide repeat protein [Chloroflexota bacterium]
MPTFSQPAESATETELATDTRARVDALLELAQTAGRDDIMRAMALAEEAYYLCCEEEFVKVPYLKGMGASLLQMAIFHHHLGDFGVALNQSYEALTLLEQAGETAGQIRALNNIGRVYTKLGVYAEALNNHLDALELSQSSGDEQGQAHSHHRLGTVCLGMEDYEQAQQHYEQALALFASQGAMLDQAAVLNDLCVAFTQKGQYQSAISYGEQSVVIYQQMGAQTGTAVALASVGEAYLAAGSYHEALKYFEKALTISQTIEAGFYTAEGLEIVRGIGQAYLHLHQFEEARAHLQRALHMAEQVESKRNQYLCHRALADMYEMQGEWRLSLQHFQRFHKLRELVFTAEGSSRTRHLQVLYQTRTAQQEADAYRRETERLEQLREQDRHYFEQLTQMQSEFLSTASHDLKNPLTGINTALHLMRRSLGDVPEVKYIRSAERQVDRMRDLIGDLLELAKLETGRALRVNEVAVNEFLLGAVDAMQLMVENKDHLLHITLLEEELIAHFDRRLVQRVLINLLSNAVKYTPVGGEVTLTAEVEPHAQMLTIRISDSGIGIPTADLPHLFERFYRVDRTEHQAVEGTGLGLAIVKSIVEQHGGRIWVESHLNAGSTFSFTLPLMPAATLQLRQNYYPSFFATLPE